MGASAQGVSGVHSISGYSETVILWIPPKNDPYFTQHQTSGVGHLKGVLSGSATDGTIPGPGHRRDGRSLAPATDGTIPGPGRPAVSRRVFPACLVTLFHAVTFTFTVTQRAN